MPTKSDGGCDDPGHSTYYPDFDRHEHPAIQIIGYDGISDSGEEIYNFCVQQGIKNIVMMGVHTNMCVLGRPFGIRQLVKLGRNVVLPDRRNVRSARISLRQPHAWNRTGDRAHRNTLVPVNSERRPHTDHRGFSGPVAGSRQEPTPEEPVTTK